VIEFGNRVVVFVLVVACAVTVVAAFLRRPPRRDLRWLSIGLILGVLGEAVLGAFVVYSKLNAYVVMCHFMVGMALLAVAVVLTLRANHAAGRGTPVVGPAALWLTRVFLGLVVVALAAGTATTGAGPHAGGKGAKRVPIGLEDMTRIHAEIVLGAGVLLVALLWVLWKSNAPAHVQDAGRVLLSVMVVQGIVGYTQFFTHLPAVLVGIHVLGASSVWATALWFHHGLSDHRSEAEASDPGAAPPEDGHRPAPDPDPLGGTAPGVGVERVGRLPGPSPSGPSPRRSGSRRWPRRPSRPCRSRWIRPGSWAATPTSPRPPIDRGWSSCGTTRSTSCPS
jgi:cytochrome c oxidase assembly protein subunit 15